MLGPSLKSVPGCLVSIVPIRIGVPVAAWPGFGPHDDVSADPLLEPPPELVEVDAALPPPPPPALELLLLLPHAANSNVPTTTAKAMPRRTRSAW
jgi:hypothetical protein